jgi:uncharacterized protein
MPKKATKPKRQAETAVAKAQDRREAAESRRPKPGVSRAAVARAQRKPDAPAAMYQPPLIPPGVVPEGQTAPVMAMDDAFGGLPMLPYLTLSNPTHAVTFPGYPYLAMLATRAEYRNMAEALAVEMTREWIQFETEAQADTIDSDDDDESGGVDDAKLERIKQLEAEFKKLGVQSMFKQAVTHDAWFGRAQFFIQIKGHNRMRPLILSPATIKQGSLERVVPVEAMWTTPSSYNALDPAAPDFYKPIAWFMLGKETHASRLLTVVTRPVSDMLKPSFNFSGLSLSQIAEPYVNNWLRTRTSVGDIVNFYSTTILKTNMAQVLTQADDGDSVFARADLFSATRTNRGLMLIDKDQEEIEQVNTPLSTLDALQAQSQEHMSSVSRIPTMILTGISPTGLNASSEGELRAWNDWVMAQLEANWRHPLEIIMKVVMLHLWGEIDKTITVKFKPLYQLTPLEESTKRMNDSTTAKNYIDAGVIDPTEVRQKLAADSDSGYSHIDPDEEVVQPETPDMFGDKTSDPLNDGAEPNEQPGKSSPGTDAGD